MGGLQKNKVVMVVMKNVLERASPSLNYLEFVKNLLINIVKKMAKLIYADVEPV